MARPKKGSTAAKVDSKGPKVVDKGPKVVNDGYEMVDVGRLERHPRNPRRGDQVAITESIRENGFFGALLVQRSTNHVLVGNHRFAGAKSLGYKALPVIWVDVDDDRATRMALADNRTNDLADYDEKVLAAELQALPSLVGTGYEEADLAKLLKSLDVTPPPEDFRTLNQETVTTQHQCPKCGYAWGAEKKRQVVESAGQKA